MKQADIKKGELYIAKVNNKLTTVKVVEIRDTGFPKGISYRVLNIATGRETLFKSAAKFRGIAPRPLSLRPEEANRSGLKHSPIPVTNPEEEKKVDEAREKAYSQPITPTKTLQNGSLREQGIIGNVLKRSSEAEHAPHVIIIARAGTGKTTTGIGGLEVLKGREPKMTPSPQQRLIWDEFAKSKGASTVAMVAFNKSIAEELQRRVPPGVDAMTLHSLGFRTVTAALGRQQPNSFVVQDAIAEIEQKDIREIRKHDFEAIKATEKLTSLVKQNLLGWEPIAGSFSTERITDEDLYRLAAHYDIEMNGSAKKVFGWVRECLERSLSPAGKITFDDMIWLPIVLSLSMSKYDLLFVDEAQDLNRCQQELALKAGKRLIFCGDDRQAIYGFAGADSESLGRLETKLGESDRGVVVLPLTVTRRCGKAIVEEARAIVPDFEAHPDNGEGIISRMSLANGETDYRKKAGDGDMVICRVNAPLISECFKFLKEGRKANIIGRDVGTGLISMIKKLKPDNLADLIFKLSEWLHEETKKENAKRNPDDSRLIALQDKFDCLETFCDNAKTVEEVIGKIETVFTDDPNSPGIKLSSGHKSKGLEADRIFFLEPEGKGIPHPMCKSAWQKSQDMNLRYVVLTRAKVELVYVS